MHGYSSITIFQRVTHHIIENYEQTTFYFCFKFSTINKNHCPVTHMKNSLQINKQTFKYKCILAVLSVTDFLMIFCHCSKKHIK